MAGTLRLDRKAKSAIAALVAVIALIAALTVWRSIVALTPEGLTPEATAESQDEIVQIGGHTLLLRHGSVGNRIAHWLDTGSSGSRAFEVHDRSFTANSDVLTSEGEARVSSFAQMMAAVPTVKARIIVMADKDHADLAERRAKRLLARLGEQGVDQSRITVSTEQFQGATPASADPELILVLSH